MPWLINPAQLDKFRKNQKAVVILDTSWHLPQDNRDAAQEFVTKHIIDAQFLDLNLFHDQQSDIPNTLILDEKIISETMSSLGIRNDYKIIFYDNSSLHTSCRALWMFKMFGHNTNQLYILDGGFKAWEKFGGKTEAGEKPIAPKHYTAKIQPQYLRTLTQMKHNLHHPHEQVVDVRHPVRYAGGKDPRPGIRAGHIPGSFSFPYSCFFDANGLFLTLDKIRRRLSDSAIEFNAPIISTCGSAITAPILNFTLDLMGYTENSVYDGSWSEWGAEKLYAGETSLAERPVETCLDMEE